MNSNKGLKIAAKPGVKLRQGSWFVFMGRKVGWSLQGSLKIHTHLTVMGQVKPDQLPAWWLGALWSSCLWKLLVKCHACALGSFSNPSNSARQGGIAASRDFLSSTQVWFFSLKFTSAQQPGTQIPWRPDLLLLPSGKAEFQIDLVVLPSRCCHGMTSKLKTA